MNMLQCGSYGAIENTEAKNVFESVVCCQNIQHTVCLQNALIKMCIGLYNMALAAGGISISALNGGDLPGKISEELLVCKICFGRFSPRKLPKLLACSHTFCEQCVRQYHSVNAINGMTSALNHEDDDGVFLDSNPNYNNFPCPICRKLTELPESGVEGLANNFTVLSLMEILVDRKRSQVDGLRDNSDTCSVKSDVIGNVYRDPRKRRRERRRGSFCSVFSVPTEVASSMTSLLGIPSIDARCSICDRRFPESEFPCGHCVCTKCFVAAQRNRNNNNEEESANKESYQTDDEVSEPPNCPACAQQLTQRDDLCCKSEPCSPIYLHNGSGIATADFVSECQQQQNNYSCNNHSTPRHSSDPTDYIYPNLAVETLESLEYSGTGSSSRSRAMNCTCRRNGASGAGRADIIPDDRPPPYNPGLYFNGNGHTDQHSVSLSSNGSSRNGSPRRVPPGHRYSASIIADINNGQDPQGNVTTPNTTTGPSSLAFSNPTYACGPCQGGATPKVMNPCDPPPPHAPERPMPQTPNRLYDQQELYNMSQCSSHTYDCASNLSNHSYESPYALRRPQSYKPPIPPRRHSSSPSGMSVQALRHHLATKKRSDSAPSAPSAPPSHDKTDNGGDTYQSPSSLYGVSPPVPPPRRIYDSPHSSPVKCVKKFGRYSEVRMQTSTFRQPTKVAQSEKGDIVVVDEQQMTVQVFTYAGDYLSMFKVIGVQGASFFSADKLAIATHRGITIFSMAGELIKELSTGLSVNTFPYKFGFVVATPKSVQIYRQSLTLVKEISKRKTTKSHLLNKLGKKQPDPGLFENLRDITVLTNKHIAVLDSGKGTIHVIDEEGTSKMTINPALETCGKLADAESLTADRSNNFYVADTGNQRVLRFTNHGTYSKTVLNCKATAADKRLYPHGVVVTDIGNLVVSLAGENSAEVRIYSLQ